MVTNVSTPSDAVKSMQDAWARIDALAGGTTSMRAAREKYLPKFPRETQESYDYRVDTSTLFNGLGRTIENMASKPFAEAVTFKDIDPVAEAWMNDIDLCGNNLTIFAHDVMTKAMQYGLTHILIESPTTVDDQGNSLYRTKAEEDKAGIRPYMIHIPPTRILGWKSTKGLNSAETLTQLRILETVEEDGGDFSTVMITQVRVLAPGTWQVYRKGDLDKWYLHSEGKNQINFIPLVTFYTKRTGFMMGTPPLNDLADLNIKHWQSSSDQDSILHTARVPILAIIGVDDDSKITVGAKSALAIPVGGDVKYVEHSGAAIEAGRLSLQDLENQMRAMGAELLVEKQVESTATQNNIEDGEAKCQLSRMVEGLEDTLDLALSFMHVWAKMEYKGSIDIFDDFVSDSRLQAAGPLVLALVAMVDGRIMSKEDAFNELRRNNLVNPDLVWKEVQARIAKEAPNIAPAPKTIPDLIDE